MPSNELLTMQDVAKLLNVTVRTLRHWRLEHVGPHSFKVGGQVRYRPETIERYIEEQEKTDNSRS